MAKHFKLVAFANRLVIIDRRIEAWWKWFKCLAMTISLMRYVNKLCTRECTVWEFTVFGLDVLFKCYLTDLFMCTTEDSVTSSPHRYDASCVVKVFKTITKSSSMKYGDAVFKQTMSSSFIAKSPEGVIFRCKSVTLVRLHANDLHIF